MKFTLGRTVMTRGFLALHDGDSAAAGVVAAALVSRHASGDWGELCAEDAQVNQDGLRTGDRLLSKYVVRGAAVYVITEADRSATTVLRAEEY